MRAAWLGLAALLPVAAAAGVDPSAARVTVYAVAVSESESCTNPRVVASYPNGKQFDFMSTTPPAIAMSYVPPGEYRCLLLQVSDVVQFVPSVSSGSCVAGAEYTQDVCRAAGGTYRPVTLTSGSGVSVGASTACAGSAGSPSNDRPAIFFSVAGTGAGSAYEPPSGGTNGATMAGVFSVKSGSAGTFVIDFRGKVDGSGGSCDIGAPSFGFR